MATKPDDAKIAGALSQLALLEAVCETITASRAAIIRRLERSPDMDAAIDAARGKLAANMAQLLEARAARRRILEQLKSLDVTGWRVRNVRDSQP